MFCRQCGQSLVHDGMFCGNCGAPIPVEDREKMRKQAADMGSDGSGSAGTQTQAEGLGDSAVAAGAGESITDHGTGESGKDAHAPGKTSAADEPQLVFGDADGLTPPELPKFDLESEDDRSSFEKPVPERSAPPGWERRDEDSGRDKRPPQYQPQPSVKSSYGGGTGGSAGESGGYGGGTTGSDGYGGGTRSYGWADRSNRGDAFTDTGEPRPIRPTSYLVPNIIVSILCCPMNILGIIGIIFSVMGNSRYDQGDYVDARNFAMVGMVLFWVTLGLGVLSWIGLGTFWGSLRYIF